MDASSQTQTRLAALPAQLRRWGSAAAALACVLNGVWLACMIYLASLGDTAAQVRAHPGLFHLSLGSCVVLTLLQIPILLALVATAFQRAPASQPDWRRGLRALRPFEPDRILFLRPLGATGPHSGNVAADGHRRFRSTDRDRRTHGAHGDASGAGLRRAWVGVVSLDAATLAARPLVASGVRPAIHFGCALDRRRCRSIRRRSLALSRKHAGRGGVAASPSCVGPGL